MANKKSPKISKEQKEIERLSAELRESKYNENYYNKKYEESKASASDLKNEVEVLQMRLRMYEGAERTEVRNLMEIIRWKSNADTAKYPFLMEKSQRPTDGIHVRNY